MELTIAEFACFSIRSKQQILDYKAHLIGVKTVSDELELRLYGMNGYYIMVSFNPLNRQVLGIEPHFNPDWLALFVTEINPISWFEGQPTDT